MFVFVWVERDVHEVCAIFAIFPNFMLWGPRVGMGIFRGKAAFFHQFGQDCIDNDVLPHSFIISAAVIASLDFFLACAGQVSNTLRCTLGDGAKITPPPPFWELCRYFASSPLWAPKAAEFT